MKKALSLFLAVLMIFAAMSVSASAVNYPSYSNEDEIYFNSYNPAANDNQAVLSFDINGGTLKNGAYVYVGDSKFAYETNITGTYVMVPQGPNAMVANSTVTLPVVTAPAGYQFDGWYCYDGPAAGYAYGANTAFLITAQDVGHVTHFRAAYSPAEIEQDTTSKIMDILFKVFGTILGLFGVSAEDTKAILDSIFGALM